MEATDENGWTPLHFACDEGHLPIVQYLLTRLLGRADLQTTDRDGRTPLHLACRNGHRDVVQYLLTPDRESEATDRGQDSSSLGLPQGHRAVVQYL